MTTSTKRNRAGMTAISASSLAEQSDLLAGIDRLLHENGNSYQQTRDQVTGLTSRVDSLQADIGKLAGAVDRLATRFEEARKPNTWLYTLVVGAVPALMFGMMYLINTAIGAALVPVNSNSAVLTSSITTAQTEIRNIDDMARRSLQADENSRTDRVNLNNRVSKLEERMVDFSSTHAAERAETATRLLEIETQFKGQSNLANQWRADQLRWDSILYEKAFPGSRFPNATVFYPQMYSEHSIDDNKGLK